MEAKKLAYADLYRYNADPNFVPCRSTDCCPNRMPHRCAAEWIRDTRRRRARREISMPGDTIVLSTADRDGNMVSWVNSNFDEFGSGLTVPGYGFILHDRGALFTLDPKKPERDRASQASLQYAVGGLRDAGR